MLKRVILEISGSVQGVGYRYFSSQEAKKRGLTGFVKNLDNGDVYLVAEGKEQDLKDFASWCYNGVGPAKVHQIDQSWSEATGEFSSFVIIS